MTVKLIVHATHEAGVKVGGIGAVLDGLLASNSYNKEVERTILLGGYQSGDTLERERLLAPRNGLKIRYHSQDRITDVPDTLVEAFEGVQQRHRVSILYGTRRFGQTEHEILLVDGSHANQTPIHELKAFLYARHGIHSDRYEREAEFNQQMSIAPAARAALQALLGDTIEGPAFLMAHEWLGLPTLFAVEKELPGQFHTIFYAHEAATIRPIVEEHPGHDLRFYNAMRVAGERGLSLEQVFGEQSGFFKHALLRAALYLEGVFAVGDLVKEELEFLEPALRQRQVDLVYNGVPSSKIALEEKQRSKALLQRYAQSLHGFEPTWVFSHVTRLIPSKGIWRDFRVMERLDEMLEARNESAIFYLLSSVQPAGRRSEDVHRWEKEYGWPVEHREGNGDLIAYESDYYRAIEHFNRSARASRILFVNQFGWSRDRCGERMPEEMEFMDLRHGSDVEFGQSIYEPFGIAQVEPLSFGALCVLSTACGCMGFIRDAGGLELDNIVVGDYLYLPAWAGYGDLPSILNLDKQKRDAIEARVAEQVANTIIERLPRTRAAQQTMLEQGYDLGTRMSWDIVARDYLLPALARIAS